MTGLLNQSILQLFMHSSGVLTYYFDCEMFKVIIAVRCWLLVTEYIITDLPPNVLSFSRATSIYRLYMESKNPNAKVHIMDFRINVIRQILEAHVAPREEAAAVTQPLRMSGRHFPRSLPVRENGRRKLKRCFVCSNTTRGKRKRKETA
ncbi:hypothetical protein J6590_090851 [Homalodisca vitripennis]|nr:hypothetical protein J6590_090851 [Homalodisca vitripennis]